MTTPAPAGDEPSGTPAGAGLPLRSLTAWALLALAAITVIFGFLYWFFPTFSQPFLDRFRVDTFANITVLVAPLLAMLVATRIGPVLRGAKLMGLLALATYAAALLFGVVAFLVSIADKFNVAGLGVYYAFGSVLQGLGNVITELLLLGLLTLAALWTYGIFTGLGGQLPKVNPQGE